MSSKSSDKKSKKDGDEIDNTLEKSESDSLPLSVNKMPKNIQEFFLAFQQTITRSNVHPLIEKFKDNHIDKALDQISIANERQYELSKIDKRNNLLYVIIGAAIFIFLSVFLLPKDKDAFLDLLKTLLVAGGGMGIGGGYTIIKFYKSRKM